ncbi:hypothetical protein [Kyrpidia sp.]|uniref:hypothetical protein n=1 Tax=Kyrpidia sp. TaxID=2073077 RepID=UPI002587A64E|nr:hypothetical protein [Kyrpidia sp.]MCL6576111.1 hypothetical protein [Kyrpidia sp.]
MNDVYRLRLQAREVFATHPPILAYVFNWYGSVFNVLLLAYGLAYWKLFYVFLGVAGQILHYSIAANKAVLFSVPFMLIISASLKRWRARFGALIMWGLIGMIVVSVLMDVLLFKRPYVTAFAVVRVILMPGLLTADYYDFFSTHQWAYWSYSFLRYLIVYPYDREPPFLIGQIYFHNPATSANANLWADGFANAGFVGVILVSLVLGFIMWIYDSIMRNKPAVLGVLCLALPSFLLSNASLQTFMSTKGFALLLLWLLFMPDPLKHQVGLRFSDREEITWSLQHSTRPKRSYT